MMAMRIRPLVVDIACMELRRVALFIFDPVTDSGSGRFSETGAGIK